MVSDKPHNDALAEDGDERSNSRRANPIDKHVGERVRMRRMLLGMSQERLGEQLGLTFQQVQKYEKGVNRIGASRLFDLAQVLGVPIQFFYENMPAAVSGPHTVPGFADRPGDTYVADFLSSRDSVELNKAFARIQDPRVRRSIVDMVRAVAGEDPHPPQSE
jgi:transcriptional regulator with XRE-family HTH domain